jgi:hypothetical protein
MNVVNTEGLTLFGSGSEWLWSMLQFGVVAITLIAIYVQVRQDRAANAFAQASAMRHEWQGEFLTRRRLATYLALLDGAPDADVIALATPIANFWENVAGLVRAGHVSLPLVYQYLGSACQTTWNLLEPQVRGVQAVEGKGVWSDFEWLVAQCVRLKKASGEDDGAITRELLAARAPEMIASLRQSIADFEAMRTVMVASPVQGSGTAAPPPAVPEPSASQARVPQREDMAQSAN